jgi:hypothetical protein
MKEFQCRMNFKEKLKTRGLYRAKIFDIFDNTFYWISMILIIFHKIDISNTFNLNINLVYLIEIY